MNIKKVRRTIKVKKSKKNDYIVYTAQIGTVTYDEAKEEMSFDVNESPTVACWVLVYIGNRVKTFFEKGDRAITSSIYSMFCGTEEECKEEIKRLGLIPLPEENF